MKKYLLSSKLFISCKSMINFSSLRLDNSIHFLNISPIRICLKFVSLTLGSTISENLLLLSFKENPDLLIFWVTTWFFSAARSSRTKFYGSPRSYMTDRQGLTNFLQESEKLLCGPLVLLALEWAVVKRAPCRWCSHRIQDHADLRTCCRWRTPGWKFQWSLRIMSRRKPFCS